MKTRLSLFLVRLLPALALPTLLSACGDLPEPFLGNPGAMARRLAVPLAPMLAIPPPANALLNTQTSNDFAALLADGLQKEDVPTLVRKPHKTDWRLAVSAQEKGGQVVPRYAILDPNGRETGSIDGKAVTAASWTAGLPGTLGQAATDAVPKVVALMMSIRATRDRANPNALINRAAKLYVPEVTGAPGDGDTALSRLIRTRLAEFGPLVELTPEDTDFTVKGAVTMSPMPKNQQQVEIAWTVTRPGGVVVGKVSQLNEVPAGSLNGLWGDVAAVVAQEASGGINTVVERFIDRDGKETAAAMARATSANGDKLTSAPPAAAPQAAALTATPAAQRPVKPAGTQPARPAATQPAPPAATQPAPPAATQLAPPAATQLARPAATQPARPAATQLAPPAATQPARPAATQPARPAATQPARPAATQPARPAATQPARPAATQPARPAATQPARPAATQPARPAATQPAKPAAKPVAE